MVKILEWEGIAYMWVKQQQYLGPHGIPAFRGGQMAVGKGQNDGLDNNRQVHHSNFRRRASLQPFLVIALRLAITCRQCKLRHLQTAIVTSRGFNPAGNPPPLQVPRPTLTNIGRWKLGKVTLRLLQPSASEFLGRRPSRKLYPAQ